MVPPVTDSLVTALHFDRRSRTRFRLSLLETYIGAVGVLSLFRQTVGWRDLPAARRFGGNAINADVVHILALQALVLAGVFFRYQSLLGIIVVHVVRQRLDVLPGAALQRVTLRHGDAWRGRGRESTVIQQASIWVMCVCIQRDRNCVSVETHAIVHASALDVLMRSAYEVFSCPVTD